MSRERRPKPTANYHMDSPPGKGPQLSFNINQGFGPGIAHIRAQLTHGFLLEETEGGYLMFGQDETRLAYAFRQLCTANNWTPRRFG